MNNELYLNKEIYSKSAIIETIMAFHNLSEIHLEESDIYRICIFSRCRFSIERTMLEFENYLISISNRERG